MKETELTPQQIAGLESYEKDFQDRCDRVAGKYNMISLARQKAIDFVKQKAARDKAKEEFLK